MMLQGFNAAEIEPTGSYDPIPAGWYKVVFTSAEEKPTKAQTGSYLQLSVEVIEGEHQGRKLVERLNLNNPNQTAVEIAQRTLSAICRAIGVMTPRDSSDLLNKPLMAKVAVKPAEGAYSASNEIKGYEAPNSAGMATPPAAAPVASSTPPWKR